MGKPQLIQFGLGGGPAGPHSIGYRDTFRFHIVGVALNAKIRCDLADDVAYHGSHDLGGEVLDPAGVVQHGKYQDLGIIGGQHGGKADLLVVVTVTALAAVQLLGSTGFAADGVTGHVHVAAGIAVLTTAHVVLHHLAQLFADFLGDNLTADVGLGLADYVARIIGHAVHHIGSDQITAVDHRRNSRGHLDGGDFLGLAESGGIQVGLDLLHVGLGLGNAFGFIGQVDAGGLGQAESLVIVIEKFRAHELGHLDEVQVAALFQSAGHIQRAVNRAVGAAIRCFPLGAFVDSQFTVAVKHLAGIHQAGIQRRSGGDQLKNRAGEIQFGHSFILPLRFPDITLQSGVFLGGKDTVLHDGGHVVLTQTGLQQVDFIRRESLILQHRRQSCILDSVGVVGVKLVHGGHGQDGTTVHIHHDYGTAVHHAVFRQGLAQVFFHYRLDIVVDGQVQVITVDGVIHFPFVVRCIAPGVLAGDAASGRACQFFLVGFFQAINTLAVGVGEAQHRGQERPVGIAAGRGLLGVQLEDGGPILFGVAFVQGTLGVGVLYNGVLGGQVHPLGQDLILAVPVTEFFQNAFRRHGAAQQIGDILGSLGNVAFVAAGRVRHNVPDRGAFGQDFAGGSIDRPPGSGDLFIRKLLFRRTHPVFFGVAQLQRIQLIDQKPHTEDDEQRHQQQRAHPQCVIDGMPVVLPVSIVLHYPILPLRQRS